VEALTVTGGARSTVAVARSPAQASADAEVIHLVAIAAAQAAGAATQQAANSPSLKLKIFEVEGVSLLDDTSTGAVRPMVPAPHHHMLFDAIHNLAHPGCGQRRPDSCGQV
jgi:hypothetical protein